MNGLCDWGKDYRAPVFEIYLAMRLWRDSRNLDQNTTHDISEAILVVICCLALRRAAPVPIGEDRSKRVRERGTARILV